MIIKKTYFIMLINIEGKTLKMKIRMKVINKTIKSNLNRKIKSEDIGVYINAE